MKSERSKLAHLVIAYHKQFERHVPEAALRRVDAVALAAMLENLLATGDALAEAEWSHVLPMEFGPGWLHRS